LAKFCHKAKFKIQKLKLFWRFSIARNKGLKFSKNHQIPKFGFECVAKDIEGGLKFL